MFARACTLGSAIGCTNYAAALWLRAPATPDTVSCARRLFERACEVLEPFGCGMVGRMMAVEATTEAERLAARQQLERTCAEYSGMRCRMFAYHLEKGHLGPYEPELVRILMVRACETGDDEACGYESPSEMFR
jgi:hypothetical protein